MAEAAIQDRLRRAKERAERGELFEALAECDEAIRLAPCAAAWNARGAIKFELGDDAGAIADFGRALEADPRFVSALFNRARARERIGDVTGARKDREAAIRTEPAPDDANGFLGRGKARYLARDFEGALRDLGRAIAIDPDLLPAYLCRGVLFEERGLPREAMHNYGKAIRLSPRDPDAWLARAEMHRAAGEHAAALADAEEALRVAPPDWPDRRRAVELADDVRWRC